jgi:MFS family permease
VKDGEIIIKLLKKPILYPICKGEYRKSQILFIIEAVLTNAAYILTGGVFLSGYLVFLKAPDFLVGILNNSATWASIVALFSFLIYERMQSRKKLLISLNISARLLVCSIVFLPLISPNNTIVLAVVTVMVILGNILWSIYSIGFTVWLMSVVSPESRSAFIFTRMLWLRISFTASSVIMGFVLDWFNKSYTGFLVVYITSLVFSIADIFVLVYIKEPQSKINKEARFNLTLFFEPLKNGRYRAFLIFNFFYYLCLSMSGSFSSLYLIRYLKFDYGFISTINVIMYIFMILSTKFWGRIESKRGISFVLGVTALFMISEYLVYGFLTERTYFLLFFSPVIAGIGQGGFNIAVFTYRYDIMPEENRTIFEGWFAAIQGLSFLIAPILGNEVMKRLPVISNQIFRHSSFQLMYFISFALAAVVVVITFFRPSRFHFTDNIDS